MNPTRAAGMAAYGVATLCCGIAWVRNRRLPKVSPAGGLTLLEGALLLDMVFNIRWLLHQFFVDVAQHHNEYAARRAPQVVADTLLVALLCLAAFPALRRFRNSPAALLAVFGGMLSIFTWCAEVISLHQVDTILYHPVERWMAVSFLWIAACLMTSISILIDTHRSSEEVA
jgi:hypothetical protein